MSKYYLPNNLVEFSKQTDTSSILNTNLSHIYKPFSIERKIPRDEGIYSEARDLLNQWVAKSLISEDKSDSELSMDEIPITVPSRLEVKKEWDHLLEVGKHEAKCTIPAGLSRKLSHSKRQIASELQRTKFVEKRVTGLQTSQVKHEISNASPLDRILQRQEEAKARRELRRQEAQERRAEIALRKQAEREALLMTKQMDEAAQREQKREEELIRLEMVRVRKQLESEKDRANRERCHQWLENASQVHPFKENRPPTPSNSGPNVVASPSYDRPPSTPRFLLCSDDDSYSEVPSVDEEVKTGDNLLLRLHYSAETEKLLHRCLSAWKKEAHHTRVLLSAMSTRYEIRLQRIVLRAWKLAVTRIRLDREVEQAKIDARILERKEIQAADFYAQQLKRTCFFGWQTAIKLSRLRKAQDEREQQRRLRETEFMEHLRSYPNVPSKTQLKKTEVNGSIESQFCSPNVVENERDLSNRPKSSATGTVRAKRVTTTTAADRSNHDLPVSSRIWRERSGRSKPKLRTVQSALERPNLPTTLLQQRQRIVEQNREIENLRSAKRYTELLLEAKAHVLAERLSDQAHQFTSARSQSARSHSDTTEQVNQNLSTITSEREKADSLTHTWFIQFNSQSSQFDESSEKLSDINCMSREHEDRVKDPITLYWSNNPFLKRMEQQAAERARLKAEREERRRLAEQKKKEELARQLEEEAKRIKEEKRAIVAAQRAKRREEEERKNERLQRQAKLRALEEKADKHLAHQRIVYYGWLPWKRFVIRQQEQQELADYHAKQMLLRSVLKHWVGYRRAIHKTATELLQRAYSKMLLRKVLIRFKLACDLTRHIEEQGNAWHEQQLMRRVLSAWSTHVTEIRIWEWQLEDVAEMHWFSTLKRRCIMAWRHFPKLMRDEQERERRLERFRSRLRDVVPDFSPPKITNSPI